MENYIKKLGRVLGIRPKRERRMERREKLGKFKPPKDPFAARSKMDIAYSSELHRDLYTPAYRKQPEQIQFLWNSFLDRYPEFEPLRADWMASRQEGVTPLSHGLPWISYAAIHYLEEHVQPDFRVFEWGMGGSTVFWSQRVAEIVSIEHDAEWFALVADTLKASQEAWTRPSLKLCLPEPDKPSEYTSGLAQHEGQSFEPYVKAICDYPRAYFDIVVVDGRARMACLEQSVDYVAPGGAILLDNSDYARYQHALDRFCSRYAGEFDRQDFLSPTPFAANIGSQTTIFLRKQA